MTTREQLIGLRQRFEELATRYNDLRLVDSSGYTVEQRVDLDIAYNSVIRDLEAAEDKYEESLAAYKRPGPRLVK
ncbi:hypothetical protein G5V57_31420 [Nordella sp. HKS 07]|uniref:hypothetical protein n=1 Tax=Nordella sp. HKS 07 TaxID=2712222 RepID=UPI0013E0EB61|nr:hypothetical protein [Nordella sp. HKS 07]QIG51822.1 hypothetical protein G5V57_31420 [Nordella sp. HKS 07]